MINYYNENRISEVILSGGCEQINLPSGYTQVEYLESSGTQYIDTGVVVNTLINPRIVTTFKMVSAADIDWWGTNNTYDNTILWNLNNSASYMAWYVRWGTISTRQLTNQSQSDIASFNFTDFHTLDIGGVDIKQEIPIKIDGVLVNTLVANGDADLSNTGRILIFRGRSIGRGQFKDFAIYSNNILIQKLIPCRRKSDNVLGMYDTVTGNFLTNAGTGDFTAGADVVPSPDTPMDIVCNNGVLKVNKNLYSTEYHNAILSQQDGVTVSAGVDVNVSAMVDCRTIKSFKITTISPRGSFRIFKYKADNTFIDANSIANIGDVITFEDNVGFFRIQYNYSSTGTGTENILIYNCAYNLGGIYADGTVETVNAHGKNFFDVSDYSSSSDWQGSGSYKYVEIPLPNGTYTMSWDKTKGAPNIYWLIQVTESVVGTSNSGIGGSWLWHATAVGLQKEKFTFTVTEGKAWFSCAFNNFNKFLACLETVQIEPGSAATEYEPYFNGGTATAEMLLKVGDYTDTQKVIKGEVRRNVGIKVLDGTEAWVTTYGVRTWGYCYNLVVPLQNATAGINTNCYSTHFKAVNRCWDTATEPCFSFHQLAISGWTGKPFFVVEQDTIQKFKQWLADQYNAGTPVIIVYPLEAPTTEEVDGQFLDGKYVEQISGAISNLPIEISNIHNLKKRYVTDSNGNATEITKIYKGDTLLWQK